MFREKEERTVITRGEIAKKLKHDARLELILSVVIGLPVALLFLLLAAEIGNKVIYGVDAHTPEAFRDTETYKKAEEFRKSFGLELTDEIKLIKRG